ncbi:hypothetical protein HanXRQr2_Chr07g0300811 [Helianthus annuus]|uniref:Uncharacterized protein n=1 Tax=Helianthus annuus TaxID=4232 RepID=A0A9K3IMB3_HELAN|nr:hypothetical protein HanXRQr2_Chr07g0300811 [Helianthus annuus]KAJ0557371.1 hypothetical protein HanIR_Chr07g0324431 [Helianthus annuus]KAJ0905188.1 hypothetical protein HanPSC8_Chr07g0291121 [Helianthus annuus]
MGQPGFSKIWEAMNVCKNVIGQREQEMQTFTLLLLQWLLLALRLVSLWV